MSDLYIQLLDATIRQVEQMKTRGTKHISLTPGLLDDLKKPAPARTRAAAPASAPAPVPVARTAAPAKPAPAPAAVVAPAAPAKVVVPKAKFAPEAKAVAFAALRKRVLACEKCPHLVTSRKSVVFGVGDMNASLMFVGEAPGADEDLQGEPFIGKAGQLLTKVIQTMGLSRETVFIANVLKCRPDTPGQTAGNRKPKTEEMETCLPYLREQIELIQPKALVALGSTAVEGLMGEAVQITKFRGRWQEFCGIPLMPTYHPSYLLRNQSLSLKREVWEDMLQVMDRLQLPISEKQRGYFLPA